MQLDWTKTSHTWKPKGTNREIPYVLERAWIGEYTIEINWWNTSVNINVKHMIGEQGYSSEDTWLIELIIHKKKMYRKEFIQTREAIIQEMLNVIEQDKHRNSQQLQPN